VGVERRSCGIVGDNYFSLLPGEKREVTARIAARDLEARTGAGGRGLEHRDRLQLFRPEVAKTGVKAGEEFRLWHESAAHF